MKLFLSLLPVLATFANAFPTTPSNDFELVKIRAELSAARSHSGAHVERESSHLDKRLSPTCSITCGVVVEISECAATLKSLAATAKENPEGTFCAVKDIAFFGNGCIVSFRGFHTPTTCISNARLSGLAEEIFNECVSNPLLSVGGCVDLEDGGQLCIAHPGNTCSTST